MTVARLITELMCYPAHAKVMLMFEMVFEDLGPDNIYQSKHGTIILDGDGNHYKERIINGTISEHDQGE